ncbi:MAG: hypothetical protein P8X58_01765, partial [Syntrophobacterales bacterium]
KNLSDGAYVSCIAVDPDNANNVMLVYSNYSVISLYYTNDGGKSWQDVAGNLEQNPDGSGNGPSCRWASILNYGGATYYYAATSTGLYSTARLNGTSTVWAQEGASTIGDVVCDMVISRETDGKVVVGTHGSGVFYSNAGPGSSRQPADGTRPIGKNRQNFILHLRGLRNSECGIVFLPGNISRRCGFSECSRDKSVIRRAALSNFFGLEYKRYFCR